MVPQLLNEAPAMKVSAIPCLRLPPSFPLSCPLPLPLTCAHNVLP